MFLLTTFCIPNLTFSRINTAKEELLESDIYASARASLREGLDILNNPKVTKIVCFGLGRIGECTIARYQLALLLCLKELCNADVHVYDPVFCKTECEILQALDCVVLSYNCEGKYAVDGPETVLFYLPHCPKQLSNNLLWSNWGLRLSKCIIIANSFTSVIERTPARLLRKFAQCISNISPYMVELAVINSFKYYEVFNDTAIHIFPYKDISLISEEFWTNNEEPNYSDNDVEFITNKRWF